MSGISLLERVLTPILRALFAGIRADIDPLFGTPAHCPRRIPRIHPRLAAVESLEPLQLLCSASLTLHTGYIRLCPTDADIVQVYESATPTGTPEHTYTRCELNSLVITGSAGDDTLTIDYSQGTPLKDGVLRYNAGAGSDTVVLIGRSAIRATISPSAATSGSGCVRAYLQDFQYAGVESINISAFSAVSLITPNPADDIILDRSPAGVAAITGTSGPRTLPPISVAGNIPKIVLDLATNDGCVGDDTVTLTGSADPAGYSCTRIDAGTGTNIITNTSTSPIPIITGTGSVLVSAATCLSPKSIAQTNLTVNGSLTMADRAAGGAAVVLGSIDDSGNTLTSGSLALGGAGVLDLKDRTLLIYYDAAGPSPVEAIQTALATGRNVSPGGVFDGPWNGSTGITSSTAASRFTANGSTEFYALGYGDTAKMLINDAADMQNLASAVFVRYTCVGDATMDGVVGDDDVTVLGLQYNPNYDPKGPGGPMHWYDGDFNYNGIVDDNDVTILGMQYNPLLAPSNLTVAGSVRHLNATLSLTSTGPAVDAWYIYWMDDTRTEYSAATAATTGQTDLANVAATHTYATAGEYRVMVVAESDGIDHVAGTITLTVAAPTTVTATGPDIPVAEDEPYTLTLDAPEGITMWTVDWGDGSTAENIAGPYVEAGHIYTTIPTGPITATAKDDDPNTPDCVRYVCPDIRAYTTPTIAAPGVGG
ncbi:MAG: hypothetical protein ABSH20_07150, partial [Tepidisphaeraceae bacterium]